MNDGITWVICIFKKLEYLWSKKRYLRTVNSILFLIQTSCLRVVKGIFVTRDRPFFFPVKCEMAIFFFVNRDFHSNREA